MNVVGTAAHRNAAAAGAITSRRARRRPAAGLTKLVFSKDNNRDHYRSDSNEGQGDSCGAVASAGTGPVLVTCARDEREVAVPDAPYLMSLQRTTTGKRPVGV
jgi:hypothetical protein